MKNQMEINANSIGKQAIRNAFRDLCIKELPNLQKIQNRLSEIDSSRKYMTQGKVNDDDDDDESADDVEQYCTPPRPIRQTQQQQPPQQRPPQQQSLQLVLPPTIIILV